MTREDLERQVSGICIAASLPITFGGAIVSAEATRQILALFDRYERERGTSAADEAAWFLDQMLTQTKILRGPYARQAMDIVTRWKEETERRELPPEPEGGK